MPECHTRLPSSAWLCSFVLYLSVSLGAGWLQGWLHPALAGWQLSKGSATLPLQLPAAIRCQCVPESTETGKNADGHALYICLRSAFLSSLLRINFSTTLSKMARSATLTATLLSFILFPFLAFAIPFSDGRPTVKIDSGVLVGINKTENSTGAALQAFLGVPFAAKPVRWGPPKPPKSWTTPFDASKYGPACVQQFNFPASRRDQILLWFNTPAPQESEDCLSACIYVPISTDKTKKAVMVWFYGGGLNYGSNAMPHYDGSTLAAHEDVIVVVVNYVSFFIACFMLDFSADKISQRTNVFGFPGSPQIPLAQNNLG